MNRSYQLPHAGMAETFCIAQKVSKNASFHKAIASIVHSRIKMLFLSHMVRTIFRFDHKCDRRTFDSSLTIAVWKRSKSKAEEFYQKLQ